MPPHFVVGAGATTAAPRLLLADGPTRESAFCSPRGFPLLETDFAINQEGNDHCEHEVGGRRQRPTPTDSPARVGYQSNNMFSRSIRIAAAIVFIVSTGPAIAQQNWHGAKSLPNVMTAFVDFTVDQLVVRGGRLCTAPKKVKAVFLGGDPLTVISSAERLMILAFERQDIEFGVSHLLSIRCDGG